MHIPVYTLGDHITPEQRTFFDEHGFIRFSRVATEDEVDELLSRVNACVPAVLATA